MEVANIMNKNISKRINAEVANIMKTEARG